MKKLNIEVKPFIISATIFVLAITFAVTLGLVIRGCDPAASALKKYDTDDYEYKSDISDVKKILNTKDKKYLKLVNKTTTLGEDYVPDNVVDVDKSYTLYEKSLQLESYTAAAAKAMIDEMRAQGISNIYITSGYRTYAYQKSLFDNYVYAEWQKDKTLTQEQCRQKVLEYSAYPGTSEHQSGLCADFFVAPGMNELVNYGSESTKGGVGFAETDAYRWMKENAHKFGFILRFPEGKEGVTGYSYESWHYRFVGVDAASKIYNSGKTLEEWLD